MSELYGDAWERGPENTFVVTRGSAVAFVRPIDLPGERTGVAVVSITNVGMRMDDELTHFIATENGKLAFGALHLDEGNSAVALGHTLLGTFLNREELNVAIAAVSSLADDYDDRIKARFGGRLARELG